ncbi:Deoxyribonuclease-2-alpha, partial [Trichinella britovi]
MKRLTREFTNSSLIQYRVVIYKAPARNIGKALIAGVNANAWQNTQDLTGPNNHAVAKSLEHVIEANPGNKFIAYNNIPPDVPKVKTKSNSKGVLMMNPNNVDEASWIVHTIPGFPKALTGYVFPPAEIQKGHLFICLTIKKSEIDAIAMALRIATPLIYHNDIPDDPARPNLKKLVNGESRLTPPLTVAQQISTAAAQGLKMTIYSKSEKSKYEIYRRVLVKKLKTGIKVWTTRDKTLKSDCRILGRNIKLVASPIDVNGDASSLDSDVSQWLISDPGNKFCVIDKPYHKSQTKEPAMAVCIDDATIFGHFNRIAMALRIATPLIYHNDIPDAEINSRPNLKKLVNGESRLTPPLTVTRQISTANAAGLKVTIYSKSEKSKYEIYRRVLVKKLKTGIKVWTTRDKILKSDCRILNRNIKLVTSRIAVDGHESSLESDVSQWLISEPGNKFCVIDKPYHKSQTKEPAMAVCIDDATIFGHFNRIGQNIFRSNIKMAIMYKAPTQNRGKALIAGAAGAWQDTVAVTGENGHSFAKALEHVIAADATNKFIAYNNIPPDVPKVNTKSNSKGLLMMNPRDADEASWIVHTVPGFPKALRGYVFPPAEIQKGHLLICLTIKESEIDAIAMALRIATPLIYHNDIPDAEIDSRPNLKKLANAASRLTPPLTVTRDISTAAPGGLKVTIYSKGEKSKYEIYRRVLVKKLKTSIKVWTTRDKILKSDCRILNRNIKLVTSPITIGDHASSLETPARNIGKALIAGGNANAWQNTPVLTQDNNHAVVKSLEHVIRADAGNKFIAYNNIPPNIPKVKTKSNSKGVLMMNPQVADEASWIVHTIPGFPKALTGY